jgi:hypothetical protein
MADEQTGDRGRKNLFCVRHAGVTITVTSMMKTLGFSLSTGLVVVWLLGIFAPVARAQQYPPVQPAPENVVVPAEGDSLPMLDFGGRPVVEVMINGKGPYRFIFDTGASFNVIDSSLAAEIGKLTASPTGGSQIQEFRIGKVVVRDAQAVVNPISQMLGSGDVPRGVLSASSFPGAMVTFDYPAKRIGFHKGAVDESDGKTIFAYDPGDLPSLPVKVAGREITVNLDTGAPYALALPTKYMKELPLSGPPVQKGTAKTHVGLLPIFMAPLNGEISIGKFGLSTRDLRFTDVVPFPSAEPKGQVGNEALRELVVTLDSMNHRIRLEKAASREQGAKSSEADRETAPKAQEVRRQG